MDNGQIDIHHWYFFAPTLAQEILMSVGNQEVNDEDCFQVVRMTPIVLNSNSRLYGEGTSWRGKWPFFYPTSLFRTTSCPCSVHLVHFLDWTSAHILTYNWLCPNVNLVWRNNLEGNIFSCEDAAQQVLMSVCVCVCPSESQVEIIHRK